MVKTDAERLPVMLFAAGFGTRMGTLTATQPKPLISVAGRALLDHALAQVDAAETGRVVVNTHYLADQIARHLQNRPEIRISEERGMILETGGGLRHALPLLGADTVFILNSDAVWTGLNPLRQLQSAWDPGRMDCLLLLLPVGDATGHGGKSDFSFAADGRLNRGRGDETHVYLGAHIIKTTTLGNYEQSVFSLNLLWDDMIRAGRAYGLVHQGGWCDVGHASSIPIAEAMLMGAGV
jgi:N-acetyl-alpha-D-muramate 1-phosphate uridylyltransferase